MALYMSAQMALERRPNCELMKLRFRFTALEDMHKLYFQLPSGRLVHKSRDCEPSDYRGS